MLVDYAKNFNQIYEFQKHGFKKCEFAMFYCKIF